MKYVISIFLLLATIGCRQKGPAEITGTVNPGEYSEYQLFIVDGRSEERRVGKECRSRWSPYH